MAALCLCAALYLPLPLVTRRRILAQINLFLTGTNPPSVSKYAELVVQVLSAFTLLASIFGWPRLPIVEAIEKWREG